ncbi:hypothetical protein EDB19DRAFT_165408 [Suillus lakei]|nr:hypothetical protein EDB19DRAFT_165408 [Suillus lakei]
MSCARNPIFFLPLERMQMEYSADDVATARGLQLLMYTSTSMAAFWTYDYVCSLHDEWTFLLRSRWTKVKGIYIIARYAPCFIIIVHLCLNFIPNENANISSKIKSCFSVISLACSECFFVLRTYALWNRNRIVFVVMLSTLFAVMVASIGIIFTTISTSHFTTSTIPGIAGCYWNSDSLLIFMPFILFFVFALVLIILTLVRVIQNWRAAKGPLHAILLNHYIFYYACGLFLSAVNVLVSLLHSSSIPYPVLDSFQIFFLATLATRMHLHLWKMDQHVRSSDALVWIPLSNVSPTDSVV